MDLFVARQPIFDERLNVYAYELLFRAGPENVFVRKHSDQASPRVIHDALHVFGLETLAGGARLFVNVNREVLVEGLATLLPPEIAVVELLETVELDEEVFAAAFALRSAGYLIALDDFVFRPGCEPLVAVADIIKVDFLATAPGEREALVRRHRRPGLRFLAEKVETREDFEAARRMGYELFQGYFFARPQMISARDVPGSTLSRLRLLQAVSGELDLVEVEEILRADPALSVKLLRHLNSASFRWRSAVRSIRQALTLLGERPFRRWAALVTLTSLGEQKPTELLLDTLVRAQFCERLAQPFGIPDAAGDLFLMGLLSHVDAIIGRPLPELLDQLALAPRVKEALLGGGEGVLAELFRAALAYEQGDFAPLEALANARAVAAEEIGRAFADALDWAQRTLVSAS